MGRDHSFFSYGTDEVFIGEYPTLAAAVRSLPGTDGAHVRRKARRQAMTDNKNVVPFPSSDEEKAGRVIAEAERLSRQSALERNFG